MFVKINKHKYIRIDDIISAKVIAVHSFRYCVVFKLKQGIEEKSIKFDSEEKAAIAIEQVLGKKGLTAII